MLEPGMICSTNRSLGSIRSLLHGRGALGALIVVLASLLALSCGGVSGSSNNNGSGNGGGGNGGGTGGGGLPTAPKVVVVVLENKSYNDVVGSAFMPYLNSLIQQGSLATNYYADTHPSLANYFMLTVGDTVTTVGDAYGGTVMEDNIVRELVAAGKTWKSYAQSLPSVGFLGTGNAPYARNHNPFTYFNEVQSDPAQQQNIVPIEQLQTDLAAGALPDYSFLVPDNQNNSHDCPASMPKCDITDALMVSDNWLKTYVDPVLKDPVFQQNGVLIITYDEGGTADKTNGGGHIPTVLVGPHVKKGYQSTTLYQHESTLRMTLKHLGVTVYPNKAATAPEMDEFFQ
jgi:phosphatidylinositol-3-phosphatase